MHLGQAIFISGPNGSRPATWSRVEHTWLGGRYRILCFSWGLLVFSLLRVCNKKKRGSLEIKGREKIGTYVNGVWSLWGERDLEVQLLSHWLGGLPLYALARRSRQNLPLAEAFTTVGGP
jgi:hypothetical protein